MPAEQSGEKPPDAFQIEVLAQLGALEAKGAVETSLGVAKARNGVKFVLGEVALGFFFRSQVDERELRPLLFDGLAFLRKLGDRLAAKCSTKMTEKYEEQRPVVRIPGERNTKLAGEGAEKLRVGLGFFSEHESGPRRLRGVRNGLGSDAVAPGKEFFQTAASICAAEPFPKAAEGKPVLDAVLEPTGCGAIGQEEVCVLPGREGAGHHAVAKHPVRFAGGVLGNPIAVERAEREPDGDAGAGGFNATGAGDDAG